MPVSQSSLSFCSLVCSVVFDYFGQFGNAASRLNVETSKARATSFRTNISRHYLLYLPSTGP